MKWQDCISRDGIWLARSGRDSSCFCSYDIWIIGNLSGRFVRLRCDSWEKIEKLLYPPETVYLFIEPLESSMNETGWRKRESLRSWRNGEKEEEEEGKEGKDG